MKKLIHVVNQYTLERELGLIKTCHKFVSSKIQYSDFEIYCFLGAYMNILFWLIIQLGARNPFLKETFDYSSLYVILDFKTFFEGFIVSFLLGNSPSDYDAVEYCLLRDYSIHEFLVNFFFLTYLASLSRSINLIDYTKTKLIHFELKWSLLLIYHFSIFLYTLVVIFFIFDLYIMKHYLFSVSMEIMSFLRGDQPWDFLWFKISNPSRYFEFTWKLNYNMKEWPSG